MPGSWSLVLPRAGTQQIQPLWLQEEEGSSVVKSKHEKLNLTEKCNKRNQWFLNPCHWIADLERLKIRIVGFMVSEPLEFVFLHSCSMRMTTRRGGKGTGTPQ